MGHHDCGGSFALTRDFPDRNQTFYQIETHEERDPEKDPDEVPNGDQKCLEFRFGTSVRKTLKQDGDSASL